MTQAILSYGGVPTPSFLIIQKVNFSVLPPSELKSLDVPMKSGSYFINRQHGIRTFTVDYTIKSTNKNSVMYHADDLASWLDYDEPQPLIFRDKPDITYYAIIDGATDITKFGSSGKGSFTLVCFDPHGYGAERTYTDVPIDQEPIIVTNGGNKTVAPEISMTFKQNVTDFAITTADEMLYFGEPNDVTQSIPTNLNPRLISDKMQSTNGWTAGLTVDGGVVTGNLVASPDAFRQEGNTYGTGLKWHGGSMIKALPHEAQDFTVDARVGLIASNKNQVGRVEVYLLDINGNKIGKIALVDNWMSGEIPKLEARAGSLADGHYFANGWGKKQTTYSKFYGRIRITRKGNKWTAYIAQQDRKTFKHSYPMTKTWTDTKNKYSAKVAAIQVHVAAWGTKPATNSMYIADMIVTEHLKKSTNQIDYIFKADDMLYINNATNEILLNGEPFYDKLYPSSQFIKFEKGGNGISISDPVLSAMEINFRERWL